MTSPVFRRFALVLLASLATLHGCSTTDSNDFVQPSGFARAHTARAVLGAFSFERDEQGRVVTSTRLHRAEREAARERDGSLPANDPSDRMRLEAVFHGSYADGMTVTLASRPEASLRVVPVGARRAPARLRSDGALVGFDEAYPGVSSAFGARQSKVEESLVVASADRLPKLAYRLTPGKELVALQLDENRVWAYGPNGDGLFVIQPPTVDDAANTHREGRWSLTTLDDGSYHLEAHLPTEGLVYPLFVDPTFEIPRWFRNQLNGDSVTGRGAPAGTYDKSVDCGVMVGGAGSGFTLLNDVSARCSNRLWKANVPTTGTAPTPRAYGALGYYGGTSQATYLFGGQTTSAVVNELYRLKLTCSTPGSAASCSGVWTKITTNPTNRPSPRILHGMAWTGSTLLVFGGVGGGGTGIRDTWSYNADTDTWTQLCTTCFGGSFGLYGFATATTVDGSGNRQVYAWGGYNFSGYDNRMFRWNPSTTTWDDVSGTNEQIPVNEDGTLGTPSTPLAPTPRNLGWAAGTNNQNVIVGSGVFTNGTTGVDTYLTDTWIWYDRSAQELGYRWLRAPVPPSAQISYAPGKRESSFAFYDEANQEVALIAGVELLSGGGETFPTQQRVYRGLAQTITLTQECLNPDFDFGTCTAARLRVVFTNATSLADCNQQRATFVTNDNQAFSGVGGWVIVSGGGSVTPTWSGTECAAQIDAPWDNNRYSDYGVRVRDNRYHVGGSACTNAGEDVTVGASAKSACLPSASNARAGSAACGGITDPDFGTITCEFFLAGEPPGQGAYAEGRTKIIRQPRQETLLFIDR